MERIDGEDIDYFLLQIEQRLKDKAETERSAEEWRQIMGFEIWMPEDFALADQERVSKIFWSENRPEILLLSEKERAGIVFQPLDDMENFSEEAAENSMERMMTVLRKLDDRTVCYDRGEAGNENGIRIYWMEYKSFTADDRVYNFLFLFQIKGQYILGKFYCPFERYERWKPMVCEMLQSVRE
ncbi:MAG: hypothetical protein PUF03_01310 [Lachnospiraceae bacterium]|nr:hypothetical protein [Lachnospiraceae bacterium]